MSEFCPNCDRMCYTHFSKTRLKCALCGFTWQQGTGKTHLFDVGLDGITRVVQRSKFKIEFINEDLS